MKACADTPPAVLQKKAGLAKDLIFADPKAPRFVLWHGKLRPVPSGPGSLLSSDLLTTRGKLRALVGALGFRPKPPGTWLWPCKSTLCSSSAFVSTASHAA